MTPRFDPALLPPAPTLEFEQALWQAGFELVAGLDEAGRGALAGPVCAAAVILPRSDGEFPVSLYGVRDSKQLSPARRENLAAKVWQAALAVGVGWCSAAEVDKLGMGKAGRLVLERAVRKLAPAPQQLLIDYFKLPQVSLPQQGLVKGDQRSLTIACASVIAKTQRDAWMREADRQFPGYGFAQNKGYGSAAHRAALRQCGPCPLHRRSFRLLPEVLPN